MLSRHAIWTTAFRLQLSLLWQRLTYSMHTARIVATLAASRFFHRFSPRFDTVPLITNTTRSNEAIWYAWTVATVEDRATGRMHHLPVKARRKEVPMATLARRLRQRLGVTSMIMLSGLVGTLCGFGCVAPALASDTIPPFFLFFPPPVKFTANAQFTGTLQTKGMTLTFKGTLEYLAGAEASTHVSVVSVNPGGQQVTTDSWVTSTDSVVNEWEIVSTDPMTCRMEIPLSGDSYPQCTPWQQVGNNWSRECTVTAQGNTTTFN